MLSTPHDRHNASVKHVYGIAAVARTKLGAAASEAEHNLRRLVGHANLLDGEDRTSSCLWITVFTDTQKTSQKCY